MSLHNIQFLSWWTFVLADLCPGGLVPAFTTATFFVTVYSFDCSTPQLILLIIFYMIISAAAIKKCQKLGTYITTHVTFCGECSGRFCIYKFQDLPESRGNTPRPSSGKDNQYRLQVLFANPYILQFLIFTFHHVNLC